MASITIKGLPAQAVTVIKPQTPYPSLPEVQQLAIQALVQKGDTQRLTFTVQNIGGEARTFQLPIRLQDSVINTLKLTLQPGQQKNITQQFITRQAGWQQLQVGDVKEKFRVYTTPLETLLLDLQFQRTDSLVTDRSGFNNHGHIISTQAATDTAGLLLSKQCYVEVPNARSLDVMGNTITMMAWVYPVKPGNNGLTDVFTKGDAHVLQIANNKNLTFFAGGWGRGDVSAPLPENWFGSWHHIAGVCDGTSLRIYIDGTLKATTRLDGPVSLSITNKWTLGRNEEFPNARIFNGYMDHVKVFAAALTTPEIIKVMEAAPQLRGMR
nr:LamG domain-containing protein [Chitinophaga sp. GbtcB8]